jgi:predicted PurR-regulated permease PerM
MNAYEDRLPVTVKFSIVLIGIFTLFYSVYLIQDIILPLIFSTLVAILLNPVVKSLERIRVNRVVAIIVTLVLALILMAILIFFIWTQFGSFIEALPLFREKFKAAFKEFSKWLSSTLNIGTENMNKWIMNEVNEGMNDNVLIKNTLDTATQFFLRMFLIPGYIFFILYYKKIIIGFINKVFESKSKTAVNDILLEIKSLIQQYLVGLLIELAVVSGLTSLGLFLLGIQNPLLLGIISGLLNLIPYIGVITANVTIVVIAFVTKSSASALYVFILYLLVQFIDNNFILPKIVGSKVKINALATIITVIAGGHLCGAPGMFLSIPVMAVFKAVSDKVEGLKPIGYLLGDTNSKRKLMSAYKRKTQR